MNALVGKSPFRQERFLCGGEGRFQGGNMSTEMILIIVVVILLLGGGGWYGRGRWY